MSAIWGAIYHSGQVKKDRNLEIEKSLEIYKIDRFDAIAEDNIILGCGHQYVTKEAAAEQLPCRHKDLYYTADVMLDNREELIQELGIGDNQTDGAILLESFLKWKEKMVDHVLGIFSAVFYDKQKDILWIFTDHTGSRCINYCCDEKGVYFSTTIGPILNMRNQKAKISEKWMAACASNCSADLYLYEGLTPFEGIWQLEAGHYLRIEKGRAQKIQYWNPTTLPKLKISDEEAIRLFRETFSACVKDVLRSSGETAITLSSGLDSTSVAAVAARELKTRKQRLHSYTSIPLKDYKYDPNGYAIPNEEPGVRKLSQYYDNIEMKFLDCKGMDPISDLPKLIPILECPYKSGVNLVWLNEIYRQARNDGCRVILKGQFGNGTISYGTILTTFYQLCTRGHFVRAFKELNAFGREKKIGRRELIKVPMKAYRDIFMHKQQFPDTSLLKEGLAEKNRIFDQILKISKTEGGGEMDTAKKRKGFIHCLRVYQHLGAFDTRLGLANGVVIRDPTKDKRIIELCMRLPVTAFASEGIERRLVRKGMRGIVPNEILDVWRQRGQQGVDYVLRIQANWTELDEKVKHYLSNPGIEEYIDKDKIREIREKTKEGISDDMSKECVALLTICSISQFLELYQ